MKTQIKRVSMALLLTVLCLAAYAQKTVTGTVKDATGEPMIGVSVIVDGTAIGGTTDLNGNFTIQKVPNNGVLKFTYVGFKEQKVSLAGKQSFNIVMEDDAMGLDDVVVVGYGTMKKKDLTGSVASVKVEDLAKVAGANVLSAMQAKVPGVDLQVSDGQAGAGADGRLKSAAGIGALLLDGLADTIRVSLTEDPVAEVPVAQELIKACALPAAPTAYNVPVFEKDPYHYERRATSVVKVAGVDIGGGSPVKVGVKADAIALTGERRNAEFALPSLDAAPVVQFKDAMDIAGFAANPASVPAGSVFCYTGAEMVSGVRALAAALDAAGRQDPILLYAKIGDTEKETLRVSADIGSLVTDGLGDAVVIDGYKGAKESVLLAFDILQAAYCRRSKTNFISCPSCGRTLYDIQQVMGKIKARFGHLSDISIGIMGCIVNGPGEMADADFGYVGGGPGRITLFEGKTAVKKNIPEEDAIEELVNLIKERGRWQEP